MRSGYAVHRLPRSPAPLLTAPRQAAKGVVSVSVDLASGVATLGVQAETAVRFCYSELRRDGGPVARPCRP